MIHDVDEIQKSLRWKEVKFIYARNSFTVALYFNMFSLIHSNIRNHEAGWHSVSAIKARWTLQALNLTVITWMSFFCLTDFTEKVLLFAWKTHLTRYISLSISSSYRGRASLTFWEENQQFSLKTVHFLLQKSHPKTYKACGGISFDLSMKIFFI